MSEPDDDYDYCEDDTLEAQIKYLTERVKELEAQLERYTQRGYVAIEIPRHLAGLAWVEWALTDYAKTLKGN